jgi:hypothetical protein
MRISNSVALVFFVVREKLMQWYFTTKDTKNVKGLMDALFSFCPLCVLRG